MALKNTFEFSSGGVAVRNNQVLLIKTPAGRGEVWTFPKGKIEKGEDLIQAALREVLEETGYKCSVDEELGTAGYFFRRGSELVNKKVNWFLMSPVKKQGSPSKEIKTAGWIAFKEAEKLLKYKSDLELLKKVVRSQK